MWQGEVCSFCGKNNYIGRDRALIQALRLSRRSGKPTRIYVCPHSKGGNRYHLTTKPRYYPTTDQ